MDSSEISSRVVIAQRKSRLEWHERQIKTSASNLASAFRALRDDKTRPWLCSHRSFEEYCADAWGMSRRRLQQIEAGENIKTLLSSEAPDLAEIVEPMKEGPLRVLAHTPPEQRVAVLREAVVDAALTKRNKLTEPIIRQARAKIINAATGQQEREICPKCKRPL